jgi:excisionase family DNA binding protein
VSTPLPLDDQLRDVALLSIDQVAQLWGCSYRTIGRLLASGALRSVPIGTDRRIPATELAAYIARHLAHPAPSPIRRYTPRPQRPA